MSSRAISTRVSETIAAQVAAEAQRRNITESDLVREILDARYSTAKLSESVRHRDHAVAADYGRLIYEIVKTRAALLQSLDLRLGVETVNEILEASERTAREYLEQLMNGNGEQK